MLLTNWLCRCVWFFPGMEPEAINTHLGILNSTKKKKCWPWLYHFEKFRQFPKTIAISIPKLKCFPRFPPAPAAGPWSRPARRALYDPPDSLSLTFLGPSPARANLRPERKLFSLSNLLPFCPLPSWQADCRSWFLWPHPLSGFSPKWKPSLPSVFHPCVYLSFLMIF